MKFTSKNTLQDLTHNLLFPAILGSMIFELLNVGPDGGKSYSVFKIIQIIIVCFYITDYLFVNGEFINEGNYLPKRWMYIIDIVIVVLYRVAFSIVNYENYSGVVLTISIILWLIFFYAKQRFKNILYLLILAILATLGWMISYKVYHGYPVIENVYFLGFLFITYFVYVFFIHNKYAKKIN